MGCNYYLYKKDESDWLLPRNWLGQYVENIVFNNITTDYKDITLNIETCITKEKGLHIGKSSAGWHFSLCIYPYMGIYNLEDWKRLFNSNNYIVKNEYEEEVSVDEMLDIITNRHGNSQVTDEELKQNHAERGLNNLLAHSSSIWDERDKEEWKQFMPMLTPHYRTDGTYDLTPDWDFS